VPRLRTTDRTVGGTGHSPHGRGKRISEFAVILSAILTAEGRSRLKVNLCHCFYETAFFWHIECLSSATAYFAVVSQTLGRRTANRHLWRACQRGRLACRGTRKSPNYLETLCTRRRLPIRHQHIDV
jgi:hypothetical protein